MIKWPAIGKVNKHELLGRANARKSLVRKIGTEIAGHITGKTGNIYLITGEVYNYGKKR